MTKANTILLLLFLLHGGVMTAQEKDSTAILNNPTGKTDDGIYKTDDGINKTGDGICKTGDGINKIGDGICRIADGTNVYTSSHMIGVGSTYMLDTYLSQEHFDGAGVSFLYTVERQKQGKHWSTVMEHESNLSYANDRSGDQEMLEGAYNFYYGKFRSWNLLSNRLRVQAGGFGSATLGFIYDTSNSNNPAQARCHVNAMPAGIVSYSFHLWRIACKARYELAVPLVCVRFSPNYGQSYYEIFSKGDYDHNMVVSTLLSAPDWRQLLTIDAQLRHNFTLRIGYLGNYQQAEVNHLKQHVYTHRLLIGITKRFSLYNLPAK